MSTMKDPNVLGVPPETLTLQGRFKTLTEDGKKIGEGPLGFVHIGLDINTNKMCAIKIFYPELDDLETVFKESVQIYDDLSKAKWEMPEDKQKERRDSFQVDAICSTLTRTSVRDYGEEGIQDVSRMQDMLQTVDLTRCFGHLISWSVNAAGEPGMDIDSECFYTVMDLGAETLSGRLADHAKSGVALTVSELRNVQWCLVTVVCGLHAAGYVGFDIRPEHIIRFGNTWKLTDFECAVKTKSKLPLQRLKMMPLYMPPEIAKNLVDNVHHHLEASRLMDVWALGLCCLEAVFLTPVLKPWYDDWGENKFYHWLADYDTDPIVSGEMEAAMNEIDPQMCAFLKKTLVKDPEKRLDIAEALCDPWFAPNHTQLLNPIMEREKKSAKTNWGMLRGVKTMIGVSKKKEEEPEEDKSKACALM